MVVAGASSEDRSMTRRRRLCVSPMPGLRTDARHPMHGPLTVPAVPHEPAKLPLQVALGG